ncbi:BRCT domain-containing protein [Fimicolochytrium jonesii]|uniref:BRCT domain-containing protein n=1 Tax=Fimicolochytrium jonesii TaxID=1396493 RepID=UPI0022FE5DBF|nr:BRCT domain-containing protein [Fimicolochytrium jonesii]KAI8819393.1 BRCT domain-containing protein [Fimicolochytrium jonesii]
MRTADKPPIFENLRFCITGFEADERGNIQRLAAQHGAVYSGTLDSSCTHLIAERPEGRKYEHAMTVDSIHVVSREWFENCISHRTRANEELFPVKETEAPSEKPQMKVDHNRKQTSSKLGMNWLGQCNIYPGEGYSNDQLESIRKMTREGGAAFQQTFDGFVTHILISGRKPTGSDMRLLRAGTGTRAVPMVSQRWLRDCYRQRTLLPTDPYLFAVTEDPFDGSRGRRMSDGEKPGKESLPTKPKSKINEDSGSRQSSRGSFKVDDFFDSLVDGDVQIKPDVRLLKNTSGDDDFTFRAFGKKQTAASSSLPRANSVTDSKVKNAASSRIINSSRGDAGVAQNREGSSNMKRSDTTNSTTLGNSNVTYPQLEDGNVAEANAADEPPVFNETLFAGLYFSADGLDPMEEGILQEIVQNAGGMWIAESRVGRGPVASSTTILCPLVHQRTPPIAGAQLVTTLWLERCIDDDKLHNPSDIVLFQPLNIPVPLEEFSGLIIGVSGYDGYERIHLEKLATALGAEFTETFSKRNTHLISKPGIDNAKLLKAKDWRIPVATAEWLYACAAHGKLLDVLRFDEGVVPPPAAAAERAKTAAVLPLDSTSRASHDEEFPATNAAFRPKFDTLEVLSCLQTPRNPWREALTEDGEGSLPSPLEVSFTRRLGRAVDHVTKSGAGSAAHVKQEGGGLAGWAPLPACAIDISLLPPNLLEGVIICLSQRAAHRRPEVSTLAKQMGAQLLPAYNDACTHFIHEGKQVNEVFKDFKAAKRTGKYVVSPEWLRKCRETGQRVHEADYPHFFNPKKSLPITAPASQVPVDQASRGKIGLKKAKRSISSPNMRAKSESDKRVMSDAPAGNLVDFGPSSPIRPIRTSVSLGAERTKKMYAQPSEPIKVPEDPVDEAKDQYGAMLDKYLDPTTLRRRTRSSLLKSRSLSSIMSDQPLGLDITPSAPIPEHDTYTYTQTQAVRRVQDEAAAIIYDDPDGRIAKRKLLEQLDNGGKRAKSSDEEDAGGGVVGKPARKGRKPAPTPRKSPRTIHKPDVRREDGKTPAPPSVTPLLVPTPRILQPAERKFLLSGIPRTERTRIADALVALGGKVMDLDYWHPDITHLIVKQPGRTEKCLAAIASGMWVLQPSYVDACQKAKSLVSEEPYEWVSNATTNEDDKALFDAIRRWRVKLGNYKDPSKPRKGSFERWRVLLIVQGNKKSGFTRLLKAGCAEVINDVETFASLPKQYLNYVITDYKAPVLRQQPRLCDLVHKGVPFIDANYCGQYLFDDVPPEPTPWLIHVLDD